MKKIILSIVAAISLMFCFGCSSKSGNLREITYSEFADMIKNKESFVIYIGSATCSHCADFQPTLKKVIKDNDLTVYYIDRSKLTNAQSEEVSKKVDLKGTPTLCNIIEGRAETSTNLVGTKTYDETVEYFEIAGYIE